MTKNCKLCGTTFIPASGHYKYCSPECKTKVARECTRQWRLKQPKQYHTNRVRQWIANNTDRNRSNHYRARYGVTLQQLEEMLVSQGGKCPICHKAIKLRGVKGRDLAVVDHCHNTKVVRGLLCTPCNLMIGYSYDSPAALRAAALYLIRYGKPELVAA